jgi:hypothetical protein
MSPFHYLKFLGWSYILKNSYSPVVYNNNNNNNNNKNPYRKSKDKLTNLNIMRKGKPMNTKQCFEI